MLMGYNVVGNALVLFFLLIAIWIPLTLEYTVGNAINKQLNTTINASGINISGTPAATIYEDNKNYVLTGTRWTVWLMIALALLSSFVNGNSLREYIVGAIIGFVATALLVLIGTSLWNTYALAGAGSLDFSDFINGEMAFIQYFPEILAANAIASLLSFVFVKRNIQQGGELVGGYY